jgi:hypothetical protein
MALSMEDLLSPVPTEHSINPRKAGIPQKRWFVRAAFASHKTSSSASESSR